MGEIAVILKIICRPLKNQSRNNIQKFNDFTVHLTFSESQNRSGSKFAFLTFPKILVVRTRNLDSPKTFTQKHLYHWAPKQKKHTKSKFPSYVFDVYVESRQDPK